MAAAMRRRTRASEINNARPQNLPQNTSQNNMQQSYRQQNQIQQLQQIQKVQSSSQSQSMNPMMTLLDHDKKIGDIEKNLLNNTSSDKIQILENMSRNLENSILKLETTFMHSIEKCSQEIQQLKENIDNIDKKISNIGEKLQEQKIDTNVLRDEVVNALYTSHGDDLNIEEKSESNDGINILELDNALSNDNIVSLLQHLHNSEEQISNINIHEDIDKKSILLDNVVQVESNKKTLDDEINPIENLEEVEDLDLENIIENTGQSDQDATVLDMENLEQDISGTPI